MTVDTLTHTQRETLSQALTPEVLSKLKRACDYRCFGTLESDEVYALTLLRASRSIDTYREQGSFLSWLMVIMYSVWKNELASRSRHPETLTLPDSMTEGWDDDIALDYVLEDEALSSDVSPEVRNAVTKLSYEQRVALHMYADGYKYREIAASLGCSTGNVSSIVSRARASVRRSLSERR